mgnify:CR=1 FL=1
MMTMKTTSDEHLVEHTLDHVELLKGHFLHAFRDTVRLPSGDTATREFVIHPGAVMIIAMHDDGRLVMERQYRYPVQQVMIEFPAGKLDPGDHFIQQNLANGRIDRSFVPDQRGEGRPVPKRHPERARDEEGAGTSVVFLAIDDDDVTCYVVNDEEIATEGEKPHVVCTSEPEE